MTRDPVAIDIPQKGGETVTSSGRPGYIDQKEKNWRGCTGEASRCPPSQKLRSHFEDLPTQTYAPGARLQYSLFLVKEKIGNFRLLLD